MPPIVKTPDEATLQRGPQSAEELSLHFHATRSPEVPFGKSVVLGFQKKKVLFYLFKGIGSTILYII